MAQEIPLIQNEKTDIEKFNEIEKKYRLYTEKLENIDFWMYSRFEIWLYILSLCGKNTGQLHSSPKSAKDKLKTGILLLKNILFGKRIRKGKKDLLILNHERKVKNGDIYECKYTECISRMYNNCYVFERPHNMGHLTPNNNRNLIYLDSIAVKGNLGYYRTKYFQKNKYKKLKGELREKLAMPVKEMERQFGVAPDLEHIIRLAARKLLICKSKRGSYEKIFQKISPKLIIEVVHYNMDCMIINEIARRKGIRTVELQHGSIHASHGAYHYDSDKPLNQLPDEIWLFSEYWKRSIRFPIGDDCLVPVGFPYFEEHVQECKKRYQKDQNRKTIVFISQWTIGEQMSSFAVEFAKLCADENIRILYKLHPGETAGWKEKYQELADCAQIEVIDSRDIDLYQLFAQSDIQAGVYSTAIFEGLGFGLGTYICDLPYADEMKNLYENGYAKLVRRPEDLKAAVLGGSDTDMQGHRFWKEDSLKVMTERIDRILQADNALSE